MSIRKGQIWTLQEKLCFTLLQQQIPSSLLQIHAFLLRHALGTNLSLLTRFISSCSDLAVALTASSAHHPLTVPTLLLHARHVFDHRTVQDTFLCNSMIRALVQNRHFHDSIHLYRDLRRDPSPPNCFSFSPDSYTFPFLLKSCASFSDPVERREGFQLHGHVIKMGFSCDLFASTGLVNMYAKSGDIGSARQVFDGMPQRSPASWTSIVVGYAREGDTGVAMELFQRMPEKDMVAFNSLVDIFVKLGDMGSARRLFDEMPMRNVISRTSIINGYCMVGDVETARVLFDEMPERNIFSWNVMIGGYCQNRQPYQALKLFREIQSDSCPFYPNEVTIVSIVPAIADMGAIDLGRWIHNYARRKGLDHGTSVGTALVDMYAKCGDICEAKRIFDGMPKRETASWNAMIKGLAVNGCAREALDLFMEMQKSGVRANEVTMIGVLSACSHGGLVEEGKRWFREMEAYGIERRIEHYGCMVDLLGRRGFLDEAERLIEEMPCDVNGILLSSLLFACGCHRDVGRAERVMKRATEIEPWNVNNYVMLRNLYAREKRWEDVGRMKEMMSKSGGKNEAGCSVIEVDNRVWEFVAGDMVHPEWNVISSVLGYIQLHMKGERGKEI